MLHYYYGPDTYAAREAITDAAQAAKADIRWIDQDDLASQNLADILQQSVGLFGTSLNVVRDPSEMSAKIQEQIFNLNEQQVTAILWDRTPPDKRSRLFKKFKGHATVFEHRPRAELMRWVQHIAHENEGAIDSAAASALVEQLGTNRWRLKNEVSRLLLGTKQLTAEIVAQEIPATATAEIFPTLDALVSGNQAQALRSVQVLLDEGSSEFYLLAMLAYQFRTLLLIRAGLNEGRGDRELAQAAGLHPFVVSKNKSIAARYTTSQLTDVLTRLAATDLAIKSGKVDARTALLMVVMNLAQQAVHQKSRG